MKTGIVSALAPAATPAAAPSAASAAPGHDLVAGWGKGIAFTPFETSLMAAAGAFCPPVATSMATGPIESGNFVVHDGG